MPGKLPLCRAAVQESVKVRISGRTHDIKVGVGPMAVFTALQSYSQISHKTWKGVKTTKIRDLRWLQGSPTTLCEPLTELCLTLQPMRIWINLRETRKSVLTVFISLYCSKFFLLNDSHGWKDQCLQINIVPSNTKSESWPPYKILQRLIVIQFFLEVFMNHAKRCLV